MSNNIFGTAVNVAVGLGVLHMAHELTEHTFENKRRRMRDGKRKDFRRL